MDGFIKNNVEEFQRGGGNFIYFNLTPLKSNAQFEALAKAATKIIHKYPKKSVYVIASPTSFFDSQTREICAKWLVATEPYVISSALIEIDGITLMVARGIYKQANQDLAPLFPTKEEAVEYLLTQQSDAAPVS